MAFSAPEPGEERTGGEPAAATEPSRNPLLAVLGAGDAAVAAVARAFADAYSAASGNREKVQQRVADLPAELEALRGRFSSDELRRALDAYRAQVERTYAELAGRGEEAWERLRERPEVRQAISRLESYGEKLDGRVDDLVDDAQDTATRLLDAAGRQTRTTGQRVAQAGQRLSGRAADTVVDAGATAADAVEGAAAATAGAVEDAGTAAAGAIEDTGTAAAGAVEDAGEKADDSTDAGTATGKAAAKPRTPRRRPRPAAR